MIYGMTTFQIRESTLGVIFGGIVFIIAAWQIWKQRNNFMVLFPELLIHYDHVL
ncbi:hypothetical protein ACJX0J_031797, partial [Zea mays]